MSRDEGGPNARVAPGAKPGRNAIAVIVLTVTIGTVAICGAYVWIVATPPTGPSEFSPNQPPVLVHPGTPGCRVPSPGLCYSFSVVTRISGLSVSHFGFSVTRNSTSMTPSGTNGQPVPLGPDARVSAIGSGASIMAVWNCWTGTWNGTTGWIVPTNANLTFVLQTGRSTNSTLRSAALSVYLTAPYAASIGYGFP